jgi:hypothetical protein
MQTIFDESGKYIDEENAVLETEYNEHGWTMFQRVLDGIPQSEQINKAE